MLVLFVLSILSGVEGPLDVVNALISAFVFVGAYGFLAKVAIGTRGFWQFYFWLLGIREDLNKFRFLWSDRVNDDGCCIA